MDDKKYLIEKIQKRIVKKIALNLAGTNLCLIGGYRLRLLDNSPRISMDLDYHSSEDLEKKRDEVITLLENKLLPEIHKDFGYEGTVAPARGPDKDSALLKTIDLAFFIKDFAYSRIEICIDIITMRVLDKPVSRTTDGVVYLTVSDQDIIEGKVIALLDSLYVRDRDIIDIFLFEDKFADDSANRIAAKLTTLSLDRSTIAKRIQTLYDARDVHINSIEAIIDNQLDSSAAENIKRGGGASAIFDHVMVILKQKLKLVLDNQS